MGATGSIRIAACDCLTPLGNAARTHAALMRGERITGYLCKRVCCSA